MDLWTIFISFILCSRTHTSLGSFRSCTASGASLSRSGTRTVQLDSFSSKWPYQTAHRSGYTVLRALDHGHQCHHRLHHLPSQPQGNTRNQTAISGHDHQKCNSPLTQLKKYFTFEVQVLDDKNVRRRFRASNYQSTTRVKPFICTMPMRLDEGTQLTIQGGTKSSLTCLISRAGLTAPTT